MPIHSMFKFSRIGAFELFLQTTMRLSKVDWIKKNPEAHLELKIKAE